MISFLSSLQWQPLSSSHYLLLSMLLVSFIITLWFARQRLTFARLSRLSAVILLNFVAYAAVVGLVGDFRWQTASFQRAVLFTEGSTPAMIKAAGQLSDVRLFALDHVALDHVAKGNDLTPAQSAVFADAKVTKISAAPQLALQLPDLQQLTVFGDGLTAAQWRSFNDVAVDFTPSPVRVGPIALRWLKQLHRGQAITVSGTLQSPDRRKHYQISLFDVGDRQVASKTLMDGDNFLLTAAGRDIGQYIYRLTVVELGTTVLLSDERVAFEVKAAPLPRILIKQSAPSFETRFLKNWATGQGAVMQVLTQISKEKTISQRLNFSGQNNLTPTGNTLPVGDPFSLTTTLLANVDLLIIDGRALQALSDDETAQLHRSVTQGLGLLVLADNALIAAASSANLSLLAPFSLQQTDHGASSRHQTKPQWPNSQFSNRAEYLAANVTTAGGHVLVNGSEGQPLVVSRQTGLGHVAISLLNSTHQWPMQETQETQETQGTPAQTSQYGQYWQYLLQNLARNQQSAYWLSADEATVAYVNEPQHLCAIARQHDLTASQSVAQLFAEPLIQPMRLNRSALQGAKWCADYWSQRSDWYYFTLAEQVIQPSQQQQQPEQVVDGQYRYSYQKNAWSSWQQSRKHIATHRKSSDKPPLIAKSHVKAIDAGIFWLLLIVSSCLLWLEHKRA